MKKDFFNVDKQKNSKSLFAVVRFKNILVTSIVFILAIGCLAGLIFLQGCSVNKNRVLLKSVSEYRKNLYVGETQGFTITFTTGKREEPYATDGVRGKMVGFGVLSVKYESKLPDDLYYEMFIDTVQYGGKLEFNPYDNSYVADIMKEVSSKDDIYLKIYNHDINIHATLKCVSREWKVSYKDAIRIVSQDMGSDLYDYIDGNKLNAECFVKIVSEDQEMNKIYWYVHVVCKNGDTYTYLIDVNSGEILAKKGNSIA